MTHTECLFAEGSAFNGEGVHEAFAKLTQTIIYKVDSGELPEEFVAATQRRPGATQLADSEAEQGQEKSRCAGGYC